MCGVCFKQREALVLLMWRVMYAHFGRVTGVTSGPENVGVADTLPLKSVSCSSICITHISLLFAVNFTEIG